MENLNTSGMESSFVPECYAGDFVRNYPTAILEKYQKVMPAYGRGHGRNSPYPGPAVQVTVRALGVQHFVVEDQDDKVMGAYKSGNGREAFDSAVLYADALGLIWTNSGSGEFFDPVSCTRWSAKCWLGTQIASMQM